MTRISLLERLKEIQKMPRYQGRDITTISAVLSNQALNLSKRDADIALRATDTPPETLVGRRLASIVWALYGRRVDFPEVVAGEEVSPERMASRIGLMRAGRLIDEGSIEALRERHGPGSLEDLFLRATAAPAKPL